MKGCLRAAWSFYFDWADRRRTSTVEFCKAHLGRMRPLTVVEVVGGDPDRCWPRLGKRAELLVTVIPGPPGDGALAGGARNVGRGGGSTSRDVVASWELLPLLDGTADVVLCSEVLEHSRNPRLIIAEAARLLAAGGLLLVTSPNGDVSGSYRFPILGREGYKRLERSSGHVCSLSRSELARWGAESGLELTGYRELHRRPVGALWWELVAWLSVTGRRRLRAVAHALWPAASAVGRILPRQGGLWMALAFTRRETQ